MSTALKCVDIECCEACCSGLWFCVIWINICKEFAAQLSGCRVSCRMCPYSNCRVYVKWSQWVSSNRTPIAVKLLLTYLLTYCMEQSPS
jgi:hypothetical protein